MRCPRCKNEIKDKSLKCSACGTKIGALCKDCGQYNIINATTCSNCGKTLLKICDECGAANLPDSKVCRKCGFEFTGKEIIKADLRPVYNAKSSSQQRIKSLLIDGIKDSDSKIITLSGESGIGKNLVLQYAISELRGTKLIWLMGTCSQMTQLSPFGYFQELLLNFFNINNFCYNTLQLKKNSIKFFKQDFPSLTYDETLDLLNLLYPDNTDIYENIYYNKAKMFMIMKKVVTTILEKMKVVFIIDKFEYIDGMSFDFIKEILKDEFIFNKVKFIITCTEPKPGMGILPIKELSGENYLDLTIAPFTSIQTKEFFKQYLDYFEPKFVNKAERIAGGIPANCEQIILLKKDMDRLALQGFDFKDNRSVIECRLKILRQENLQAYRLLVALSVLGAKTYPAILENFDSMNSDIFEKSLNYLVNLGYISQINTLTYEFKTEQIWKNVVSIVKEDKNFEEILNSLLDILNSYHQSSPALLAYISQKLGNNNQAFDIWTAIMKYAAYIGDIGLYIIVQKQALKLIENKNSEFYIKVKKNIYTRVGKLLEPIDYNAAMEYLQNAVMMLEDNEDAEQIELLGYISSCAMGLGNYYGVIECVSKLLSKLPKEMVFDRTLVKSRMIKPLLNLGNYDKLVNIVETELFPEIEKVLKKGKDIPQIDIKSLFDLWLNLYFDLAEALTYQGNKRVFEVIQTISDIMDKNKTTDSVNMCKMYLLLALANTLKGDITTSKRILEDMLNENILNNADVLIISKWNFIDILNKFFEKEYTLIQNELFNVVSYANNVNDSFTKNIFKTLLAKIFKQNNQTKKALEILDEQVTYFAKEKMATGVLLCWYMIAEIKLQTGNTQFALDITSKALDIAKETDINNYFFIALFNKLIGEAYMAKQDFDSSKVYFEKALQISKNFELEYIQFKTYIQCARLYQELALPKSNSRNTHIKKTLQIFQLAKSMPIVLNNNVYQEEIKENLNILQSFCKLNKITIKDDLI